MASKSFIALLMAMVVVGGGLGATFYAGVNVGKNRAEASVEPTTTQLVAPSNSVPNSSEPNTDSSQLLDLQERIRSGEQPTLEELQQLREKFLGAGGTGGFGGGGAPGGGGGGGLSGTIEALVGNAVTVNTAQGPLQAVISGETVIQRLASIAGADLEAGDQVTIMGQRNDDGVVEATTILIAPEGGLTGLFGGARAGGGFRRGEGFGGTTG
jgi:hypothetical protein